MQLQQQDYLMMPVDKENPAIEKIQNLCVSCGICKNVCDSLTVAQLYNLDTTKQAICMHCGQCAVYCPTNAIRERQDYRTVKEILHKKEKTAVFSIAPSVRIAVSEAFGAQAGLNLEKKLVTALRRLGADYVMDITFGADLTIMEETTEFLHRLQTGRTLPMFTSCCPAWVRYAETFYPEILPHISSCKSPIAMQGAVTKTYFAAEKGLDTSNILNVTIAPCTAKKAEIQRSGMAASGYMDTDISLTTRELIIWLQEEEIDMLSLEDGESDFPLGKGSGAGVIFGNTGGVCEAVIRTAYHLVTGENMDVNAFPLQAVRGADGIREATIDLAGTKIKVAIASGLMYGRQLVEQTLAGEADYQLVEVMNCSGGCIAGGGQPKSALLDMQGVKQHRTDGLYDDDMACEKRVSDQNPEIIEIYEKFLTAPCSEKAIELLHTSYTNRSAVLKGAKAI